MVLEYKDDSKLKETVNFVRLPEIGEWIKTLRKERGLGVPELGKYLHRKWNVANYTALSHIYEIERGHAGFSIRSDSRLRAHASEISDYVHALCGNDLAETGEILNSLQRLRPEYGKLESNISQYQSGKEFITKKKVIRIWNRAKSEARFFKNLLWLALFYSSNETRYISTRTGKIVKWG